MLVKAKHIARQEKAPYVLKKDEETTKRKDGQEPSDSNVLGKKSLSAYNKMERNQVYNLRKRPTFFFSFLLLITKSLRLYLLSLLLNLLLVYLRNFTSSKQSFANVTLYDAHKVKKSKC